MKKQTIAIALLALALTASACVPPNSEVPPEPDSAVVWDNSDIEDLYCLTGVVEETGEDYVYRVPHLPEHSPDAESINERIEAREGAVAEQMCSMMEEGSVPSVLTVDWNAEWNGNTAALVLETVMEGGIRDYSVYNYDFEHAAEVSNEQILNQAGFTHQEFTEALLRSVVQWYDRNEGSSLGFGTDRLVDLRAEAISAGNLVLENQQLYLDESGALTVIFAVGTGSGEYMNVFLYPEHPGEHPGVIAEMEFIRAELADGQVQLSFTETENAKNLLPEYINYDVTYPVDGLYGEYVDLYVLNVGQDFAPFLFLVDTDGGVYFCDVMTGVRAGGVFTACGPLSLAAPVVSMEGKLGDGGSEVYAYDENGGTMDVAYEVIHSAGTESGLVYGSTWQDVGETTSLRLNQGVEGNLVWERPDGMIWQGAYNYVGMTTEGLRFDLSFWTGEGIRGSGMLYVDLASPTGWARIELTDGETVEFDFFTPSEQGYDETYICELAEEYYFRKNGSRPGITVAEQRTAEGLLIHLYDDMGTHTATSGWYVIDPVTLTGWDDITGESVDLNEVLAMG